MKNVEYSHKHILIVDDDQDLRFTLRGLLEFQGYICEEADNGATAIELLRIHDFNLIITDYQMPQLDGLLFFKHLTEDPTHKDIPVIMITGRISEDLRKNALQEGIYAILEKPYSGKKILSLIKQALNTSPCSCLKSS